MDTAPTRRRWALLLGWTVAAAVLAATFLSYFSPDMAVTLANFVWSCFGG
jgi:hypothetical protein